MLFCVKSPDACTGTRQQANANDDSLPCSFDKILFVLVYMRRDLPHEQIDANDLSGLLFTPNGKIHS